MAAFKHEYKCIIIGDKNVGKTSFSKRIRSGIDGTTYNTKLSVALHPIVFDSNDGEIKFILWDTFGQEIQGHLDPAHYEGTDCAIIMFDLTNTASYTNVEKWYTEFIKTCNFVPTVLCGNKADVKDRKILASSIVFHCDKNIPYFDVSARSNYNFENIFLCLARLVKKKDDLEFDNFPELLPAEVEMDSDWIAHIERDLEEAVQSKKEVAAKAVSGPSQKRYKISLPQKELQRKFHDGQKPDMTFAPPELCIYNNIWKTCLIPSSEINNFSFAVLRAATAFFARGFQLFYKNKLICAIADLPKHNEWFTIETMPYGIKKSYLKFYYGKMPCDLTCRTGLMDLYTFIVGTGTKKFFCRLLNHELNLDVAAFHLLRIVLKLESNEEPEAYVEEARNHTRGL